MTTDTLPGAIPRRWLFGAGLAPLSLLAACGSDDPGECAPAAAGPKAPLEQERNTVDDPSLSPDPQISELGLALSPDGARIAANETWERKALGLTDTSGTVVWDTASGTILHRFDNGLSGAVAWHPGGELLAISGRARIDITDPAGDVQFQLTGHQDTGKPRPVIRDLAFSPDGQRLASLSTDGTVRLWALGLDACAPEHVLRVRRLEPTSLAFSPDGDTLAICGPGRAPELWDAATGKRRSRLTDIDAAPSGLAYGPSGDLLIGTSEPAGIHIVGPDGSVSEGPAPLSQEPMYIAPAADGRVAIGGKNDNQVMLWDRSTEQREDLPRVAGSVGRLRWSPDGTVLYGASRANGVIAWEGETWRTFDLP